MNDLERELSDLPWRKPSDALRDRIFDAAQNQPVGRDRSSRGISVEWSVLFAAAAGLIGFMVGNALPSSGPNTEVAIVGTDIRVVETTSTRNSFDFSSATTQILPGEFTAYIDDETENVR